MKTKNMKTKRISGTLATIAAITFMVLAHPVAALEANKSNLWYGGDEGIEVVLRTGENIAYTKEDPKIDPPESLEVGQEMMEAFRTVTDLPVKAIVYTHNHFDHVAAVKAFTTEEDVAAGKVDIYAHETLMQGVINWASTVGPIEGRRTSFTGAVFLPKGPDGSVHDALGPDARVGTVTFIPPTKTFNDELDVKVAGVKMHLRYVPSETNDEIVAWFPELKLLNSAEVMQGESFPNLYTIRGTKYRDPVQWFKSIDVNMTLGIRLPDVKEGFGLEIRRGVVQFHQTLPAKADVILVADREYLNRMLVGDINISGDNARAIAEGAPAGGVAMMAAIDSGDIKIEGGSKQDVQTFFSYFDDPVDVGAIDLIVR
jgi:alkyl sulfatase BDS1-like metallo-beta-lactamase superfamily hydrolase